MVISRKNDELVGKSYHCLNDFDRLINLKKHSLDSGIQTENQRKFSAGRIGASQTGKGEGVSYA